MAGHRSHSATLDAAQRLPEPSREWLCEQDLLLVEHGPGVRTSSELRGECADVTLALVFKNFALSVHDGHVFEVVRRSFVGNRKASDKPYFTHVVDDDFDWALVDFERASTCARGDEGRIPSVG